MILFFASSCSKAPLCPAFAKGSGANTPQNAGKTSPFAAGGMALKKTGKNGDSMAKVNGKRKGDTNRENAFSTKIKKKGPPPEKKEVGLWPAGMRRKQ